MERTALDILNVFDRPAPEFLFPNEQEPIYGNYDLDEEDNCPHKSNQIAYFTDTEMDLCAKID